ncbi:MAG: enoyl-CoA hydratase/isomerase family protein [Rhodobiaceae bacterium]|nr:enoyl-CoA hydratase/isomerase family protein [Rhodobiaceae bacterium]
MPDYFTAFRGLAMERADNGVLTVTINDGTGGPITFTAQDHTDFTEAFYRIAQDRENKIVILTGAGDFMAGIDFASFGNVADPDVWSQVHDEGVQIVENIANIRVPLIAAIEGKAHVHSEYALLANVIVAGESATFNDLPHFAGGIVPGDGIFTAWSYRAGPGRAEAWLLNPAPISAQTARDWGVVAEVVPDGSAVARAREIAALYLAKPDLTRRNTRIHFIQPLKEALVRQVGYGMALEGASAAALVKSFQQ